MTVRATDAFEERFQEWCGAPTEASADAGGRVNLIGEHTDYHGGLVLPAAIDLRTYAFGRRRSDGLVRVRSENRKAEHTLPLANLVAPPKATFWSYLVGPIWALQESRCSLGGMDIWVSGDVPLGGGLSSSASVEVAVAGLASELFGLNLELLEISRIALQAENQFCGVPCGIMDQVASACGKQGHALLLDCRSLELEAKKIPEEWAIVVADSMVRHQVAGPEYARRQEECAAGLDVIRRKDPSVRQGRDLHLGHLEESRRELSDVSFRRLRHVVTENARVVEAGDAIESKAAERVGHLLAASHESLARDYEVSCPELDILVELSHALPGLIGARMTGAGFGGNTVNLVRADLAADFCGLLGESYLRRTGRRSVTRIVRPAHGLRTSASGSDGHSHDCTIPNTAID